MNLSELKKLNNSTMLFCLIACSSPQTAYGAAEKGWIFHQMTDYSGRVDTLISPTDAKVKVKDYTLYVHFPKSKVDFANDKTKTYMSMSCDEWLRKFGHKRKPGMLHYNKGKHGTVGKLAAQQYIELGIKDNGKTFNTREFWMSKDTKLSRPVEDLFSRILHLPAGIGFPLRLIRNDGHAFSPVLYVDTIGMERKVIAQSNFSPPAGYKKVATEMDLIMGADAGAQAADDLGGFLR
jgi:hypothetical protein